jgi:hypothetical protein
MQVTLLGAVMASKTQMHRLSRGPDMCVRLILNQLQHTLSSVGPYSCCRPAGIPAITSWLFCLLLSHIGVKTGPGFTQTTGMPWSASS